jgi:hypothetical protein
MVLDIKGRWDKVLCLLQSKYGSQEGACLEWQHAADQLGRADSLLKQQSRSCHRRMDCLCEMHCTTSP